jgi:sugar lactone lactonase YvrE
VGVALLAAAVPGCISDDSSPATPGVDASLPPLDGALPGLDAGGTHDSSLPGIDGTIPDATTPDATIPDATTSDTTVEDAADATANDATVPDTSVDDAGTDAADATVAPDAPVDTGAPDVGTDAEDAALPDAALPDAGADANGPADASVDVIETLAQNQKSPFDVTVDSNNVYWTNTTDGTVMQYALDGGALTTLATTGNFQANGIAVSATTVYWTDFNSGNVQSIPIGGGDASTIATGEQEPQLMTIDSNNVYWAVQASQLDAGGLMAAPLDGGPPVRLAPGNPVGVVVSGDTVAFTNDTAPGSIVSVLTDGGSPFTVFVGSTFPNSITRAGSTYYFGAQEDGGASPRSVWTVSVSGPPAQILWHGQTVGRIVNDGTHLFWVDNGTGQVLESSLAPADGEAPIVIAQGQGGPIGLAVAGGYVYWANYNEGTIRRAPVR